MAFSSSLNFIFPSGVKNIPEVCLVFSASGRSGCFDGYIIGVISG
jgi:hypothetical protein